MNSAAYFPEWKQEVNRRVAAHRNRKTSGAGEGAKTLTQGPRQGRAAEAAARVAARYANAPRYGDVLTETPRTGGRRDKNAAAQASETPMQYVLGGMEATTPAVLEWAQEQETPGGAAQSSAPAMAGILLDAAIEEQAAAPSWELETAASEAKPEAREPAQYADAPAIHEEHAEEPTPETVTPIYANLIEFPREMVAARRARPRRAEGPLAAMESTPQLSIFEVEPATISIEPLPAIAEPPAQPEWMRTEWPGVTLEAEPETMALEARIEEDLLEEPQAQAAATPQIELAPASRRLLAMMVDWTVAAGALVGTAVLGATRVGELPGLRAAVLGTALALVALGAAYYAVFLGVCRATPGMWYAGIELRTFGGERTTRGRRCRRLLSVLLSVLPLGLGFAWSLFDEGRLTWHDRLSKTYLRKR